MTSPSRRKRRITARGPITAAPTLASLAALLLCLGGASAQAPQLGAPQKAGSRLQPIPVPAPPSRQVPAAPITPVRFQPPAQPGGRGGIPSLSEEVRQEYQIQVEPPGLERLLLSLTNDADLQERIRQETFRRDPNERVTFPDGPILSRDRYFGRGGIWPQRAVLAEPHYVCYGKLFFEDRNAERAGWELGMFQTFLSPALFFADVALLPMKVLADPCGKNDCSAGHCMPGDPTPFRLYPLEITPQGVAGEVAAVLALVIIFP